MESPELLQTPEGPWSSNSLPFEMVSFPLLAQAMGILVWDMYFTYSSLLFSSLQPSMPFSSPDTCLCLGEGGQESQGFRVNNRGGPSLQVSWVQALTDRSAPSRMNGFFRHRLPSSGWFGLLHGL